MEKIIEKQRDNKNLICKNRHDKKVYLITGSSMGIGYSILKRLAQENATVILTSRKKENCEKAEQELKSLNLKFDTVIANFNSKEDRVKVFQHIEKTHGLLNGLVCNVAVSPHFGDSLSITEKEFEKIFQVNIQNTFFTIKEFLPLLKKAVNPSVLIISSQAGYTPFQGIGIYSVSKTALIALTKLLGLELSKLNVRVNGIAPGIIRTRFAEAIADSDEAKSNFLSRAGIPDEVCGIAAFLLSEDASFITGETYSVNGGMFGRL
jgi:dehydrogenase/reductase SDR family protein 4